MRLPFLNLGVTAKRTRFLIIGYKHKAQKLKVDPRVTFNGSSLLRQAKRMRHLEVAEILEKAIADQNSTIIFDPN